MSHQKVREGMNIYIKLEARAISQCLIHSRHSTKADLTLQSSSLATSERWKRTKKIKKTVHSKTNKYRNYNKILTYSNPISLNPKHWLTHQCQCCPPETIQATDTLFIFGPTFFFNVFLIIYIYFLFYIFLYWSIDDLQCHINFRHRAQWLRWLR